MGPRGVPAAALAAGGAEAVGAFLSPPSSSPAPPAAGSAPPPRTCPVGGLGTPRGPAWGLAPWAETARLPPDPGPASARVPTGWTASGRRYATLRRRLLRDAFLALRPPPPGSSAPHSTPASGLCSQAQPQAQLHPRPRTKGGETGGHRSFQDAGAGLLQPHFLPTPPHFRPLPAVRP